MATSVASACPSSLGGGRSSDLAIQRRPYKSSLPTWKTTGVTT
jgi:hypothetical protein